MAVELVAQGADPRQRWRVQLDEGETYVLGRTSEADLPVPWDPLVSRKHCRLIGREQSIEVERCQEASNPVLFAGHETSRMRVDTGCHFVVGATCFSVVARTEDLFSPQSKPIEEVAFSPQTLRNIRFHDADNRLSVLTHLPEVIAGAQNDRELYHRLVNLQLKGVSHAEAAAVVSWQPENNDVVTLHWDRRRQTSGSFHASRRLVQESIGRRKNSVLFIWSSEHGGTDDQTLGQEFDWAFCTPVPGLAGPHSGLYVTGRMGKNTVPGATLNDSSQIEGDVKFTELVAEILGAVLKAKRLERQQAGLRQFFAPPILSALGDDLDTGLLSPCECDVTVMFCDLRGFSQRAELAANDLLGLLERVSRALGVMTEKILAFGGVTGDFQGDATLGFWGWPFPSQEAAVNACRAALAIRSQFAKTSVQKSHPLADFAMGIGMAHGRAVAGKIGTSDQVKVTVFGPVVNLASRLEGMTKSLNASIILDDRTVAVVRDRLDASVGRIRRLARVLPYGTETPVLVHELLPPVSEMPELTDEHLAEYERGVDCFIEGRWEEAYRCLHAMPPTDRAHDFLIQQITSHNRSAPSRWDGIVRLASK